MWNVSATFVILKNETNAQRLNLETNFAITVKRMTSKAAVILVVGKKELSHERNAHGNPVTSFAQNAFKQFQEAESEFFGFLLQCIDIFSETWPISVG